MKKMKITLVGTFDFRLEDYLGAKNAEDAVRMQQEYLDNGQADPMILLGDDYEAKVVLI